MIRVMVEGPHGLQRSGAASTIFQALKEIGVRVRQVREHEAPLVERGTVDVLVIEKTTTE